jgi:hypothetical protein
MAKSAPTRVDADLFAAAQLAGKTMSRSGAQQIVHWARIGQQVDGSSVTSAEVAAVLEGELPYDVVSPLAQAAVRTEWGDRMRTTLASLDLQADFIAEGRRSWVEADEDGNVVFAEVDDDGNVVRRTTADAAETAGA